jgi:hypothetical protein
MSTLFPKSEKQIADGEISGGSCYTIYKVTNFSPLALELELELD